MYENCQGLVEILCGSHNIFAGVGLDKLRVLWYTGKAHKSLRHLIRLEGI